MDTPHGKVPTPVFSPVGSQATVKTLTPEELKSLDVGILIANTYHLYLRPGVDIIQKMGGLHRFMGWDGPLITDSGGYQIFSLARLRDVGDEGVSFRSHIDGSRHLITPELAIQYQESLGADFIMALDEVPPPTATRKQAEAAMERTHRWAERCREAQSRRDQTLFAIVQGGVFPELRRQSAGFLASLDFSGYAIGGLSLGEPKTATLAMVEETVPLLPPDKPRHLMGGGSPEDIVEGVYRGIDIFDCALPTQVARKGALYTWRGRLNIRNAAYSRQEAPIDPDCGCYTCRHFSAAYLHHLFRCQELLSYRLNTIHNLYFMSQLMKRIREAILDDGFRAFREAFLAGYRPTDERVRLEQKQKWLDAHSRNGAIRE